MIIACYAQLRLARPLGPGSGTPGTPRSSTWPRVSDLPSPAEVPVAALSVCRTAGMNGTRLSAMLGPDEIGFIEVEAVGDTERLLVFNEPGLAGMLNGMAPSRTA